MKYRAERLRFLLCAVLLFLLSSASRNAAALEPNEVPDPLRPWIRWALESEPSCPVIGDSANCVWPGVLQLDLDESGGRFNLEVTVDRDGSVPLPGSDVLWPQEVNVGGGIVAVVLNKGGVPSLALPAGSHRVQGQFRWTTVPETLPVPEKVALVKLRLRGKPIASAKRDKDRIWLKADQSAAEEPEGLSLEVFRNLVDGVPFRIDTRMSLSVSGRAREVSLGNVLLDGARPLQLVAAIPVRLEQGLLYAQVYPGKHELRFESLLPQPPEQLRRPAQTALSTPFWPEREVWAFTPNGQARQVKVSGSPGVDPQQTALPAEWKQLAAYSVAPGEGLELTTERRGEPDPAPNRLQLQREMWLDLDGRAYTIRDRISGTMNRDWRLSLASGQLGRVVVAGNDQLITKDPTSGLPGVELREGQVDMVAEWRTQGGIRELAAVGWSEDIQQLGTQVHVPPGWRLLSASGVDSVSETWLSSWDLFALFFVLVVALATARLTHPVWGALALVTMVLTHGEPGAPAAIWLVLVTAIALLKVIPRGAFRHVIVVAAALSAAALVVLVTTFSVAQIRAALYPQVEESGSDFWLSAPTGMMKSETAAVEVPAPAEEGQEGRGSSFYSGLDREDGAMGKKDKAKSAGQVVQRQQDPEAVIQTGPGVPDWTWRTWSLDWSGPVHRDQKVRLYLLSPLGSKLIGALRTGLCFVLGFLLLRFLIHRFRHPPTSKAKLADVATAAKLFTVGVGLTLLFSSAPARAEVPNKETLEELKSRLVRPPDCAPDCLSVSLLELAASKTELRFKAQVHAGDTASYQLPGPAANWLPSTVSVNGISSEALVLGPDGFLHLRLPKGRHRVEFSGPAGSEVTLSPGHKPHRVEVKAPDWELEGLSAGGQIEGSLLLRRRLAENEAPPPENSSDAQLELPPWLEVTRTFDFAVTWTAQTSLRRVSPLGSPVLLRIPLLPGERVTSQGVTQERQEAVLTLGRDEETTTFESTLRQSNSLSLTAAGGRNFSEHWVVRCSPIWRCSSEGLAPLAHTSEGRYQPDFRPWPGESVTLNLSRPLAEAGRHTTIDQASLELSPGARLLHGELHARIRSSTQGMLPITLPAGSEVQELLVNGVAQPIGRRDGALEVSLSPGSHELRLTFQQPGRMTTTFVAPKVKLGGEMVNVRVRVNVPEERWLLLAWGPRWGPAVLFWGYLLLILLLAPLLARLPNSKLRSWQWALLGLGLTQLPTVVAALIVGWFFAFSLLPRLPKLGVIAYNFRQLGLAAYSLIFLGCLFGAVYDGLLSTPDMEVTGAGSTNRVLQWYVDRSSGDLPTPSLLSTSLWAWRIAMLVWALWLAWNLIQWLRWAWQMFTQDGLWRFGEKKPPLGPGPGGFGMPPFAPAPATGPYPGAALSGMPGGTPNFGSVGFNPVAGNVVPANPAGGNPADVSPAAVGLAGSSLAPSTLGSAVPSAEASTHRERPLQSAEAAPQRDESWQEENTLIEPIVKLSREQRAADAVEAPEPPAARAREVAEEFEERPTLPRLATPVDALRFSAFDFSAAAEAIERMGEAPEPAAETKRGETEVRTEATEEPVSKPASPPSRPPPKPARTSNPPKAGASNAPIPTKTPPGGFALEDLRPGKLSDKEEADQPKN
jgi:hypothetical protein